MRAMLAWLIGKHARRPEAVLVSLFITQGRKPSRGLHQPIETARPQAWRYRNTSGPLAMSVHLARTRCHHAPGLELRIGNRHRENTENAEDGGDDESGAHAEGSSC